MSIALAIGKQCRILTVRNLNSLSPCLHKGVPSFNASLRQMLSTSVGSKKDGSLPLTEEKPSIIHFKQSPVKHPLSMKNDGSNHENFWENPVPHPIYSEEELSTISKTHVEPMKISDKLAFYAVKAARSGFDLASGFRGPGGAMTYSDWVNRCLFLETVAGVPGMVAGMCRHLKSLRSMQRDHGWIHTLLEEAENERMHLLIFIKLKNPGLFFRSMVLVSQGIFFNAFFFTYLISPQTCHRFVGYLEEEAVKTYTGLLQDIEDGHLKAWSTETAPQIARSYYHLRDDATVYDMIKCIRADEANHRDVNHTFADIDYEMGTNPYIEKKK
mmetsp:Transcript_6535/g.8854  ORF Transcript_6535/g.8854 Transcript_6535/m.8854 type:complete len:328 (+) Transcript_6535:143-1126(+)|eukprot:CAMPEP_0117753326 /NCGR_PEP_ID=MMETSP0947-20121206/12155_1 /TAXON_ID=44440 /ORGANISM="Chattonella subsalsa, Strain CCMP2191" /LENGTH=327 /DNA_ID=CAMNT_0005572179 /DNA_START=90 /DNA_END=1073 /DNA_ORIENTATION=-